jgi:hypothetical protein
MSDIPQAPDWWQANDGKWYPPQPGQAAPDPFEQMQQQQPQTQPFGTNPGVVFGAEPPGRGCMSLGVIITVVTLLIGAAITAVVVFAVNDAAETIDETFDTEDEQIDSVEVTSCERDESSFNWATATVEVTNETDERSTFFVEVTFESRNGRRQFGTGNATVTSLQPGRTIESEVSSVVEVPRQFTCTVTSVDRISA